MAIQDYTFGGMKARVWFNLQNLPKYTDEFLGLNVNKAVEWLIGRVRISQRVYQATSVNGQQEYELPENIVEVQSCSYDGEPLNRMSLSEFVATGTAQSTVKDAPTDYYIQTEGTKKYLDLFPTPDGEETIEIYGIQLPDRMAVDSASLPFAEMYSDCVEAYATFLTVKGQPEEEARAAQWLSIAESLLTGTKHIMRVDKTYKIKRARL